MIYMAGDNGRIFDDNTRLMAPLQLYGWQDITEMAGVETSSTVATVVQFDTLRRAKQYTYRYYIDQSSPNGQLVEKIPPVNTGDPQNLTDFIVWATQQYPAENYALVLWGHGTGWNEDDIYERYRELDQANRRDETRAGGSGERLLRRALFLPTVAEIMSIEDEEIRGICYDDTSMDFLDNHDLAQALHNAADITQQRLSILGMDACLMGMIEVAYQVQEYADYMVASQEEVPGDGWPYGNILEKLIDVPEMSARELSELIVEEYYQHYSSLMRGGTPNHHAAIDLRKLPLTFETMREFSELVAEIYSNDLYTQIAFDRAKESVQRFGDTTSARFIGNFGSDYCDLWHLIELVYAEYGGSERVSDLANDIVEYLTSEVESPIMKSRSGPNRPNARGLSIYFPAKAYSPFYDKQAFAESGWGQVVRRVHRLA
jgi:hypothetical protein